MNEWKAIHSVQDLPKKSGDYLVTVYFGSGFIDNSSVVPAYFHFEQKTWQLGPQYHINALLFIFDVFENKHVDYVTHWREMPELPEGV